MSHRRCKLIMAGRDARDTARQAGMPSPRFACSECSYCSGNEILRSTTKERKEHKDKNVYLFAFYMFFRG